MDGGRQKASARSLMKRPVKGVQPETVAALVTVAFEGFYSGTSEPAGWSMVGYHPLPAGVTPVDRTDPDGIPVDELLPAYEVVVIGAGAGGGVAACELAEAGRQVLLVERARPMRDSELRDNHIQGKRDQLYGVTAGPGPGNPRVWEHPTAPSSFSAATATWEPTG